MTHPVSTLIEWLREAGMDVEASGPNDTVIEALTFDSRCITAGTLFAALPGSRVDGHAFIEQALAAKAAALLVQSPPEDRGTATLLHVKDTAKALAQIAARFYGPLPKTLHGVTGTNGKTSVAHFVRLLKGENQAVSIGTLGMIPDGLFDMPYLTSPDQIALAKGLAAAARSGRDYAVIEASSHGLDQGRLDGLAFDAAAFTNLSRDHLDYHADMEDYWRAKRTLFTERLKPSGSVIVDERTAQAAELASIGPSVFRLGGLDSPTADLGYAATPHPSGLAFRFRLAGQTHELALPLYGTFQAENIAVALGLGHVSGMADLAQRLQDIDADALGVPGRMMPVVSHPSPPHGRVLVDYAHTPDALATVLQAARPHCPGRLIVAFGAGGDRDPGKRVLMGEAAAKFSDLAIVTDDNPRTEDPAAIRRSIMKAVPDALAFGDRREAISAGIQAMQPGDLFIIAGKGHETGQIIGHTTLPFDDAAQARRAAEHLWGA